MVALMEQPVVHRFHAHGKMGKIFQLVDDLVRGKRPPGVYEVLLEGPAGTGKSRAALELVRMICRAKRFRDVRVLLARKTLKSMRDTILVELETAVLLPDELPRKQRQQQSPHYYWPETGAEAVCAGFDDPNKILSGQFDIAFLNEGKEITINDYETVLTRMRNGRLGWHLVIIDTNPDSPHHWLNKRADADHDGLTGMRRIANRLDDNPRWVDQATGEYTEEGQAYVGILDRLTGVRYRRYRKGEWCMAEGAIWPQFDEYEHVISGELTQRHSDKRWGLYVPDWGPQTIELLWFFASVDWGYRAPGCMQVWGVDKDKRAFLVSETYMTGKEDEQIGDIEWWADRAEKERRQWDVQRFVCDSADPDSIAFFNRRMGQKDGYHIAVPAKKQKLGFEASASCVRERLRKKEIYFLRDTLREVDPALDEAKKPTRTVEEIPGYEYRETKDGQPVREEPRPDGDDHGCDALRYGMWFLEYNDWRPDERPSKFPAGSYGALMGHDRVLEGVR